MDGLINLDGRKPEHSSSKSMAVGSSRPLPPTCSSDPIPSLSLLPACVSCIPADGLPLFSVAVTK